jgi:hypothetical protein
VSSPAPNTPDFGALAGAFTAVSPSPGSPPPTPFGAGRLATGGGSVGPQPTVNVIASNERPMNWMENRNIDLTSKKNEKVGNLIVRPPNAGFQTVSATFYSNFTLGPG